MPSPCRSPCRAPGRLAALAAAAVVAALAGAPRAAAQEPLVRGDANGSLQVDISDAIHLLSHLFSGGPPPRCPQVGDANADGRVDIADAITVLTVLFVAPAPLSPLSAAEETACRQFTPPPVVLRVGQFVTLQHDVAGRVEHMSDHTLRIRRFAYDGGGLPEVYFWLHKNRSTERNGIALSGDLRRPQRYDDASFDLAIPPEVTGELFDYVSVWCTSVPVNYGYARLFRPAP